MMNTKANEQVGTEILPFKQKLCGSPYKHLKYCASHKTGNGLKKQTVKTSNNSKM